ncbi:RDD family protein [Kitasatospora sp. NPDC093806]|uniref:RDD family protein n=1 Tax=Kitasatospora sp. NPDC093806 TaxID=3155075 RepID=UPI0034248E89
MAQGYPQAPAPAPGHYGPPQQYGPPPQQYGQQQQYGYGAPQYGAPQYGTPQYGAPHHGAPQHARPQQPTVPRPAEAGSIRRFLAATADAALAAGAGFAAAKAAAGPDGSPATYFATLPAVFLAASFANQVLLTRLTGFSLGKGLLALRSIRRKDASRPHTWRLTKRWLLGFVIVVVGLLTEDPESEGTAVGVRVVRRKHLREYRQATARLR